MKIGLDFEGCILRYPEFFRPFIEAMSAAGHTLYFTANHHVDAWPRIAEQLVALQIDPSKLDASLMRTGDLTTLNENKKRMIEQCDFAFDDWRHLEGFIERPIFIVPE